MMWFLYNKTFHHSVLEMQFSNFEGFSLVCTLISWLICQLASSTIPAGICLLKVKNSTSCEIYSKTTIMIPEQYTSYQF